MKLNYLEQTVQTELMNARYGTYLKRFRGYVKVTKDDRYRLYDSKGKFLEVNFEEHLKDAVEWIAKHSSPNHLCLCKDLIEQLPRGSKQ